MHMSRIERPLTILLVVSALMAGTSCIVVPMRVPTKTRGIAGAEQKTDLSFLAQGRTRREEVLEKLKGVNAGVPSERLFWGRWATSSWGIFAGVGGYGGAAAGAEREWGAHNVFVIFDQNGVVQSLRSTGDKEVVHTLAEVLKQVPPCNLADAGPVDGMHVHTSGNTPMTLLLTVGQLDLRELSQPKHSATIPWTQVQRITDIGLVGRPEGNDPNYVGVVLKLRKKTAAGNAVKLQVGPLDLFWLLEYAQATAPETLAR